MGNGAVSDRGQFRRLVDAVNAGFAAMDGRLACWIRDPRSEGERDRVNRAYNEGVTAATEAMKEALEAGGFSIDRDREV